MLCSCSYSAKLHIDWWSEEKVTYSVMRLSFFISVTASLLFYPEFVCSNNKNQSRRLFLLISEAEHRSVKKGGIEVQEIEGKLFGSSSFFMTASFIGTVDSGACPNISDSCLKSELVIPNESFAINHFYESELAKQITWEILWFRLD